MIRGDPKFPQPAGPYRRDRVTPPVRTSLAYRSGLTPLLGETCS